MVWLFSYVYVLSPQLDAEYSSLCQVRGSTNAWQTDVWVPLFPSACQLCSHWQTPRSTSNFPYLPYCPKSYFSWLSPLAPALLKILKSCSFLESVLYPLPFKEKFCFYHFSSDSHHLICGLLKLSLYNSLFCYSFYPLPIYLSDKKFIALLRNSPLLLINKSSLCDWSGSPEPGYPWCLWHCVFHFP